MTTNNFKINANLYLVRQTVSPKTKDHETIVIDQPVNHILEIDVSGSMSGVLPSMRNQIKKKLPKLLKPRDTLSIVWFSGRGQCGILLEGEPVATLADLKSVEQSIDRWLVPVGLTGFKEPLDLIPDLVKRLNDKNAGISSLVFMSDGYDNQWTRDQILASAAKAGEAVSSAAFVEFGYYADRQLLAQMAERCGGSLIFTEDFDRYAPAIESLVVKKVSGSKRVNVDIHQARDRFAFAFKNGELLTFAIDDDDLDVLEVPEDLGAVWYLSEHEVGEPVSTLALDSFAASSGVVPNGFDCISPAYAAIALYAQRMNSDTVLAILREVADTKFINTFSGCFGKQKYSDFVDLAKNAAFDKTLRFTEGRDPNAVPADDAFTVLDLLNVLASDDDNFVLLDHEDFKYKRISRGTIDASTVLTDEEQAQVDKLTEEMNNTKTAKKKKELALEIAKITDKPEALKFESEKKEDGYPINKLVYNEDFPNISINIRREGTVDISSRVISDSLPKQFQTFQYRSYAIVKDGLVNVDRLPCRITAGTVRALKAAGMPENAIVGLGKETDAQTRKRAVKASDGRHVNVNFDLKSLPIINRKMVTSVSAKELFEKQYELCKVQASKKVFDSFLKDRYPGVKSKGFVELYGQENTEWLKEQGFTDYSGFNPKRVQAESVDFYMAKELGVSLKGLSSLPTLAKVLEKMKAVKEDKSGKKKYTISEELMIPNVEYFLTHEKQADIKEYLEKLVKGYVTRSRELLSDLAKTKLAITVGQVWPQEFKSLDENSLTIDVDGRSIECKLEMNEKEVKI